MNQLTIKPKIDWSRSISELDKTTGQVNIFDIFTGEKIGVLSNKFEEQGTINYTEIKREDGSILLVQEGIDLKQVNLYEKSLAYSPELCDMICARIANGESLKGISLDHNMPSYATFGKWKREKPEFLKALDQAHEDYADYLSDEMLRVTEELYTNRNSVSAEHVSALKLYSENIKWKAQVHKPRTYSPKVKVEGNPLAPIRFIIDTGIRRRGDPGYNIDETEKLKTVNDPHTQASDAIADNPQFLVEDTDSKDGRPTELLGMDRKDS